MFMPLKMATQQLFAIWEAFSIAQYTKVLQFAKHALVDITQLGPNAKQHQTPIAKYPLTRTIASNARMNIMLPKAGNANCQM